MNADTLRETPNLLDDIAKGSFQVVFMCPEFVDPQDKGFMKITGVAQRLTVFTRRLGCIVVDEAHLVYIWRNFRSVYATLSRLEVFWPNVLILTLSATM